jgi:hypothetical protein
MASHAFLLSERIDTKYTPFRSRQPTASVVENAPRAAKQPGPPAAPNHAKGINNV